MTTPLQIETSLTEVEALLVKVGDALKASRPEELQQASTHLRDAVLQFSQVLENHSSQAAATAIAVRIRAAAARLASQRDALARVSAMLDRRVAAILPEQAPASTYGPRVAAQGSGLARIYKSAG